MRVLTWLLRVLIFLVLFGLALNNRQHVVLNGFFGAQWQAPLILMCLVFFAVGCALGALSILWRQWRRQASSEQPLDPASTTAPPSVYPSQTGVPSQLGAEATVRITPR
jgi:lipopolysaccharide assembly protein A